MRSLSGTAAVSLLPTNQVLFGQMMLDPRDQDESFWHLFWPPASHTSDLISSDISAAAAGAEHFPKDFEQYLIESVGESRQ